MIRVYARIVGGMLLLMGLLGLADLMSTNLMTSFYYVAVGVLFLYLGFLQRDAGVVREVIWGVGVLLVLVMGITIVAPLPWGEKALLGSSEVTCLVLGIQHSGRPVLAGSRAMVWGLSQGDDAP